MCIFVPTWFLIFCQPYRAEEKRNLALAKPPGGGFFRPGGFLCWVVSKSRTRWKRTQAEEQHPTWFGNHSTKKPPRGGGVLSIRLHEDKLILLCVHSFNFSTNMMTRCQQCILQALSKHSRAQRQLRPGGSPSVRSPFSLVRFLSPFLFCF